MSLKRILLENVTNDIAYHITRRNNWNSIKREGLKMNTPDDMDDIYGVYLFRTKEDADTALDQWFGDRIDEWEEENDEYYDEIMIEVSLVGIDPFNIIKDVEYEYIIRENIPPRNIIGIVREYQ